MLVSAMSAEAGGLITMTLKSIVQVLCPPVNILLYQALSQLRHKHQPSAVLVNRIHYF